ncbi:hypothetical protein QF047_001988 [Arthrobacter sp. W4I7]|nr:hypothetical protein [Arthrobacter sp. W4I7]
MLSTPPGQEQRVAARGHQARREDYGVQSRTALAVHREAGHADRQAGFQQCEPCHVSTAAHGVADDHVGDGSRLHPGIRHEFPQDGGQKLMGAEFPQRPIGPADGSAPGCDDHGLAVRRKEFRCQGCGSWNLPR